MLVGLDWRQASYLAAGLHEVGIETYLLTTGRPDFLGLGRYCEQIRSPRHASPEYLPFLREQIGRVGPDLLIPLCEPLTEMLWGLDPPPAPIYPPTERWQREIVLNRTQFYRRAESIGLPVPQSLPLAGQADLEEAGRKFGFPLVIRGTAGASGNQVRIAQSPDEAAAALERIRKVSPQQPFAQPFVRGGRYLIGGLFRQGEMIRSFAQRATEAHPKVTGPSIRVRTFRDERLSAHTEAIFRDLQWSGIAFAEFIRNEAGEYVLMEINVRPWGSIEVAELHGAAICRTFGEMLLGRPVGPQRPYRLGVDCVVLEGFLLSRRQTGTWSTLRLLNAADGWLCMKAVPWRRPSLAFHVLRRAYRVLAG